MGVPFAIAQCSYEKINLAGQLLNKYADTEQVRDLNSFNRLVQQIQELKMLVEIHHLGEQVTLISYESETEFNGCIPGLENY
jgi:hypothetical protein